MYKLFFSALFSTALIISSCGNNDSGSNNDNTDATTSTDNASSGSGSDYDSSVGAGKFKNVEVSATVDQSKAEAGEKIYDVKCSSCHKLTDEKLVGPGWKGVTARHKPEWILNFVTNVDEMLDKDPKAQSMLEVCLVRMPNQNLTDDDAMNIYEFMRKNDGVK